MIDQENNWSFREDIDDEQLRVRTLNRRQYRQEAIHVDLCTDFDPNIFTGHLILMVSK